MSRIYTDEHLNLIADTKLSAREIGEILNVHPVTIYRFRKNNNIKVLPGAKLGKPNIKKMRQELRNCIGKNCLNTFTVQQSSKKKYCCHSCQQRTANVAAMAAAAAEAGGSQQPGSNSEQQHHEQHHS